MAQLFTITHLPQFTEDNNGNITSVLLIGNHIFTRMTQINIDSNGTGPTQGTLQHSAIKGSIDATATQFAQICENVEGMLVGDQRTLDIEGTDGTTFFTVTGVSVVLPGGRVRSGFQSLGGVTSDTDTGTEG